MTIAILPTRLANQIAAGEVVERPASVIKELVENALDAGATSIHLDIDKGGVKKIRISDNGCGIVKDELTLALSRHATSKIKNLSDLEAINSLGFRGEALASISSVSRLTLISKPNEQSTAWQANAQGRDMEVTIKPAAHPDGTTIEVLDLFFNTPARRKFLRTEKTEFNHIDEVVRRIALARFDVAFSLSHNGKIIRQYRAANTQVQKTKRVAMICGQKFVDNAIEVDCQHNEMNFSGWLAKPSFARNQNDLCYSYVNGRMMRDKLINHAIRQAYADLLPAETYPAFVLFITLDHREVDVNVHPAKHEVRFHQSRYVHDFIYSVCHQALTDNNSDHDTAQSTVNAPTDSAVPVVENETSIDYQRPDYITSLQEASLQKAPLQEVNESAYTPKQSFSTDGSANCSSVNQRGGQSVSRIAASNYQQLMTPVINSDVPIEQLKHLTQQAHEDNDSAITENVTANTADKFFITIEQAKYGVFKQQDSLYLMSLCHLAFEIQKENINQKWQQGELGLISQPLLLPLMITLTEQKINIVKVQQELLKRAGIIVEIKDKQRLQIRQYPALLRENDVNSSFGSIIDEIEMLIQHKALAQHESIDNNGMISVIARVVAHKNYNEDQAQALWTQAKNSLSGQLIQSLLLNSTPIDLISQVKKLESLTPYNSHDTSKYEFQDAR